MPCLQDHVLIGSDVGFSSFDALSPGMMNERISSEYE